MENPTYPIAETGMYYKNEDGTIYWDIFVGEDLERITGDVVLEISISGDDYLVHQLPSNSMPPQTEEVPFAVEDGVVSVSVKVLNRAGLGIEDFRDAGRIAYHTVDLDACDKFYIQLIQGSVPVLVMGIPESDYQAAYSVTENSTN